MNLLFGRDDSHDCSDALRELLNGRVHDRAMARNLIHDHRVSREREKRLSEFLDVPCTKLELQNAVVRYFQRRIRYRKLPDYVYHSYNAPNLLTGRSDGTFILHPDHWLVRIVDLTGMGLLYRKAHKMGHNEFSPRLGRTQVRDESVLRWLDMKLLGKPQCTKENFVAAVLRTLNEQRQEHPYQPSWATAWNSLSQHLEFDELGRWLEVLGIYRRAPRWVIVLRYRAREAGTVAHPTVLDAGWWPFYFPSAPQAPWGHPLNLSGYSRAPRLLPEFIHKQIDHTIEHWTQAGCLCQRTSGTTNADLESRRRAHLRAQQAEYGEREVLAWMPEAV